MIVTHAPVRGYGDDDDLPHRGFEAFWKLLERYHPRFLVHGHVHLNYGANRPREVRYGQTRLINAFERYTLDLPEYEVNGYLNIKEPRERKSIFDEDDGLKMLR